MIDLSATCLSALSLIGACSHTCAADDLPAGVDLATVEYLHALHLLDCDTLVPPGMEREFYGPHGLVGYRINEAGREQLRLHQEMLHQRNQDAAEKESDKAEAQLREDRFERKSARRSWVQWSVNLIVSLLSLAAGGVIEYNTGWVGALLQALGF